MEKFKSFNNLASGVAAIAIPVVVAVVGAMYASSDKDREVRAKYVEIAIGVLSKEPSKGDENVRAWAIKILDSYSDVKLDPAAKNRILTTSALRGVISDLIVGGSRSVKSRSVRRVVILDTQQNNIQSELSALRHGKVAYHYLIDRNGKIHRLEPEMDVAFFSPGNNSDAIGIGIMHITGSGSYTKQEIESVKKIITDIRERYNLDASAVFGANELDQSKQSDFGAIKEGVVRQ